MLIKILIGVIALIIGLAGGYLIRKSVAESKIRSAEEEAKKIIEDAAKDTEAVKKEAILEAKDEAHKIRMEAEQEAKERRGELPKN